jgi:GTPase SAR1 family protein
MTPHYYRNANGVIFVYDMTIQSSLSNLISWINECKKFGLSPDVPCVIVGNKCDEADRVEVSTEAAQRFADSVQMPLFETSAKDDSKLDHVESIFVTLAYKMKSARSMKNPSVQMTDAPPKVLRQTSVIKLQKQSSDDKEKSSCC